MIDYAYPEIWYSSTTHKTYLMTDGTVTVSGTSYSISDETITIDNSILDSESVDLKQAINPELQLYFGSSQSATLSFVIRYTGSTLKGKVLKVYIIPNHDASKILQIGVFKVDEDRKINDEGKRNITAHDALYDIINADVYDWYNNDIFPSTESTCTVEELRNSFFEYFGITEEETELINDDLVLTATRKNEQINGALVLKWICELNGVFGMITNEGKFRYVELLDAIEGRAALDDPDIVDIPYESIVETSYEDYKSKALTGLSILTSKGNGTTRWLSPGGDGVYVIVGNGLIDDYDNEAIRDFIITLSGKFGSRGYQPATVRCIGNPLLEVGDAIKVPLKNGGYIVTYILERNLHGIQALRDTYNASGTEVWQREMNSISYKADSSGGGGSGGGGGGGSIKVEAEFAEIIRNIGFRLLDEPSNVSVEYDPIYEEIRFKWTDPDDISTNEPTTATWAGTVVVRGDSDNIPLHRWGGTLITDSTTRDEYSVNELVDNDPNLIIPHTYAYGIFPYDTRGWYRFTKVVQINTYPLPRPEIDSLTVSGNSITAVITIPTAYQWSSILLVYKKNSEPQDSSDGTSVVITQPGAETILNLSFLTTYYFKIFSTEQTSGREFASEEKHATTGKSTLPSMQEVIRITKSGTEPFDIEEVVTVTQV